MDTTSKKQFPSVHCLCSYYFKSRSFCQTVYHRERDEVSRTFQMKIHNVHHAVSVALKATEIAWLLLKNIPLNTISAFTAAILNLGNHSAGPDKDIKASIFLTVVGWTSLLLAESDNKLMKSCIRGSFHIVAPAPIA